MLTLLQTRLILHQPPPQPFLSFLSVYRVLALYLHTDTYYLHSAYSQLIVYFIPFLSFIQEYVCTSAGPIRSMVILNLAALCLESCHPPSF